MGSAPSPAIMAYMNDRLSAASVFMLLHSAIPAIEALARCEEADIPEPVRKPASIIRRTWPKFVSDHSPASFHRLCDELWHCRNIDRFEQYLSGMLFEVFTQRPETLRSSETIRVSEVLECGDMNQAVRRLAERKVAALSYRGFDELLEYLHENLGLPIDPADPDARQLREGVEVRNIIVHNAGIVNATFRRRTGRTDLVEEAAFPIDQEYMIEVGRAGRSLVKKLNECFVAHFKLQFAPARPSEERSGDA